VGAFNRGCTSEKEKKEGGKRKGRKKKADVAPHFSIVSLEEGGWSTKALLLFEKLEEQGDEEGRGVV